MFVERVHEPPSFRNVLLLYSTLFLLNSFPGFDVDNALLKLIDNQCLAKHNGGHLYNSLFVAGYNKTLKITPKLF